MDPNCMFEPKYFFKTLTNTFDTKFYEIFQEYFENK